MKRSKRIVLRQLVNELFKLNKRDHCWDPIGSIDIDGMNVIIEVIASGKLSKDSKLETKMIFKRNLSTGFKGDLPIDTATYLFRRNLGVSK